MSDCSNIPPFEISMDCKSERSNFLETIRLLEINGATIEQIQQIKIAGALGFDIEIKALIEESEAKFKITISKSLII